MHLLNYWLNLFYYYYYYYHLKRKFLNEYCGGLMHLLFIFANRYYRCFCFCYYYYCLRKYHQLQTFHIKYKMISVKNGCSLSEFSLTFLVKPRRIKSKASKTISLIFEYLCLYSNCHLFPF